MLNRLEKDDLKNQYYENKEIQMKRNKHLVKFVENEK